MEELGKGSQEPLPGQPLCAVVAGPSLVESPEPSSGSGALSLWGVVVPSHSVPFQTSPSAGIYLQDLDLSGPKPPRRPFSDLPPWPEPSQVPLPLSPSLAPFQLLTLHHRGGFLGNTEVGTPLGVPKGGIRLPQDMLLAYLQEGRSPAI